MELMTRLWQRAVRLSGDPDLGLHVGEEIRAGSLHAVAPLVMHCASMREVIEDLLRYHSLVSQGGVFTCEGDSRRKVSIVYRPNALSIPMTRYQVEGIFSALVNFSRWLLDDERMAPESVWFSHTIGHDEGEYRRIFRCPVHFGKGKNVLTFVAEQLRRRIPQADPMLREYHRQIAETLLSDLDANQKIALRLKDFLLRQVERNPISLSAAAAYFRMSQRSLQRFLQAEGVTFKSVIEEVRMEKAHHLLSQSDESLNVVAGKLGYSNTGSFHRAFRRWYRMTPETYRRRKGSCTTLNKT